MKMTWKQSFKKRWRHIRLFAAVVRSPIPIRNAFEGHFVLAWWWKCILALHGKPTQTNLSIEERCTCVADGFRFYGWLYRALAIILGGVALVCSICQIADSFLIACIAVSAVYLWITSALAFSGATEFCGSMGKRVWQLVAFLFFLALFLAAAVASISIQLRYAERLPSGVNCIATFSVMAFGIGSYLLELAALVQNGRVEAERLA